MRARSFFTIISLPVYPFELSLMRVRVLQVIVLCLLVGVPVLCQTASTSQQRSHVDRFSTPQVLAARAESEASDKLKLNANDAEALNARAYARMGLGRYAEAVQDLRRAVALAPSKA